MDNLQSIEETDIDPHYSEMEYLTNYRFNEFENTILMYQTPRYTINIQSRLPQLDRAGNITAWIFRYELDFEILVWVTIY